MPGRFVRFGTTYLEVSIAVVRTALGIYLQIPAAKNAVVEN
jgi:hypothetical protein